MRSDHLTPQSATYCTSIILVQYLSIHPGVRHTGIVTGHRSSSAYSKQPFYSHIQSDKKHSQPTVCRSASSSASRFGFMNVQMQYQMSGVYSGGWTLMMMMVYYSSFVQWVKCSSRLIALIVV